jgi:hypothetical protein
MESRKRKRKNGVNSEPTETENSEPRKKKAADKPSPGITILYYSDTIPLSGAFDTTYISFFWGGGVNHFIDSPIGQRKPNVKDGRNARKKGK